MEGDAPAGGGGGGCGFEEVGVGEGAGGTAGWYFEVFVSFVGRGLGREGGICTFFVSELEAGEVIAEDLGVGVVTFAVAAAAAEFTASSYAVGSGRIGRITCRGTGRTALKFLFVFSVDSFLEVCDPAVYFGLSFEEAFADVFFDYWEVVCCLLV